LSGVANMTAGLATFNRVKAAMKSLPLRIRAGVAKDVAPLLTSAVQDAYDSGQTVYSTARPTSKDKARAGAALTLKKTGATRSDIGFTSVGTIVRAVLGRKYQRYLVGKYQVLPNGAIPVKWRELIAQTMREWAQADLEREGFAR
jgi:hypothetical protein